MITADEPVFPNNVVEILKTRLPVVIDQDIHCFGRPLRPTDPQQSIGVFGQLWNPDEESVEILGRTPSEPTLQGYLVGIQAFVKDGDEERGLAVHSVLSMRVRSVLYRDEPLRVALSSLSVTHQGATERLKRWGVRTQRYFANEIDAQWVYLSVLEFFLETEIR